MSSKSKALHNLIIARMEAKEKPRLKFSTFKPPDYTKETLTSAAHKESKRKALELNK